MKVPLPTILIDTREQMPYEFQGQSTERSTLKTGDYSLAGFKDRVSVERKDKSDMWGCIGSSRRRFIDCLERLAALQSPAIVVESSLDEFAIPPSRSCLTPAHAVGSVISWSQEYRIPIFFCPNRAYAERVTLRWLQAWWRHHNRG